MLEQIKSKDRVADHGEVFTAEREVNAMLDLVKQETERIQYLDSSRSLFYALLVPVLYHGLYDFCLMQGSNVLLILFNVIVLSLYFVILKVIGKESKEDRLF